MQDKYNITVPINYSIPNFNADKCWPIDLHVSLAKWKSHVSMFFVCRKCMLKNLHEYSNLHQKRKTEVTGIKFCMELREGSAVYAHEPPCARMCECALHNPSAFQLPFLWSVLTNENSASKYNLK